MFTYETFKKVNNKGADQTAQMRRLVCACVVRNPPKTVFSRQGPYFVYESTKNYMQMWQVQKSRAVLYYFSLVFRGIRGTTFI